MCVLWTKKPEKRERLACHAFCIIKICPTTTLQFDYMIKHKAECWTLTCHQPASYVYSKQSHMGDFSRQFMENDSSFMHVWCAGCL